MKSSKVISWEEREGFGFLHINALVISNSMQQKKPKLVSIMFRKHAMKWENKILAMFSIDILNFVNLIKFLKNKEKQEEYKGLDKVKVPPKVYFNKARALNARPTQSSNFDVYNKRSDSKLG